jgi:hypothetical protein
MEKVYKLTEIQKDQLVGHTWDGVQYFNPTQDADGNWFISSEEVNGCTHQNGTFEWIHDLPEITHNPIIRELPM